MNKIEKNKTNKLKMLMIDEDTMNEGLAKRTLTFQKTFKPETRLAANTILQHLFAVFKALVLVK